MPVETCSYWKQRLDSAINLADANEIFYTAIGEGQDEDLRLLFRELYQEYTGPDPTGGEVGTRERIKVLLSALSLSNEEISSLLGVDVRVFRATIFHG